MNYPESVRFLYALGNEIKTAKFGLDRIRTVLGRWAIPSVRAASCTLPGPTAKARPRP